MLSMALRPCVAPASLLTRTSGRSALQLHARVSMPSLGSVNALSASKRLAFSSHIRPSSAGNAATFQRRAYGGFRNSSSSSFLSNPENVVYALIGANGVVYFLWNTAQTSGQRNRMVTHFTTSSRHLDNGMYHTLLTSVFSHSDFMHLLSNMFGLFFFGREISYLLGPKRFLGLYLASGVVSSWAAVQEQKQSRRMSLNLGASGAVNSITALSILLFPHSTLLLFGIVPIPAWLAGSAFIGRDLYSWLNGTQDGIGHFAHLSGAACGGMYYAYMRRGLRMYR